MAREAIGLSMAIEEQQAGFYRNGASVPGVLSMEGTLKDDQYKQLRGWLEQEHSGARNSGRPMIIDRSAKWLQMSMSSVDAQTAEQRRYQVEEICRAMRVMPIMVGHADKTATYASAEQMFLAHLVHTLSPWYERIEQEIDTFLLTDADSAGGLYAKFIEEGLLRGALKDTAEYLQKMTGAGIMTRNEARAKLDMNPIDGLDDPLTPVNMVAGDPPTTETNSPDPEPERPDNEEV
jgi:HK97 family phage portal protein